MLDGLTTAVKRRINKIATIGDYWAAPCSTPWTAIAKVLPDAAREPVIALLSFGLDDILRAYFRPKGLNAPRKLRRRRSAATTPLLPELGEEIGTRLPGAETVKGRRYGTFERWAWLADGVIQRALYHLLIFDAVADTWFNAVQALRREGYCTRPTRRPAADEGVLLPNPWCHGGYLSALFARRFTSTADFTINEAGEVFARRIGNQPIEVTWTWRIESHIPRTINYYVRAFAMASTPPYIRPRRSQTFRVPPFGEHEGHFTYVGRVGYARASLIMHPCAYPFQPQPHFDAWSLSITARYLYD